jgi:DNA-binding transcriptional MerR regulator
MMLKIGEFARLSQISMKTLRHYDRLGLLRPSQIDPENGYRLYQLEQLADIMRIQALKDCGFGLEEIGPLLKTYDVKAIEALLQQRVAAQQKVVEEEQSRLQRLMARIKLLSSTDEIPHYDVVLKQTQPLTLIGLRQTLASRDEIGPFSEHALKYFEQQMLVPIGALVYVYYDVTTELIDLFIGAPAIALPSTTANLTCERLNGGEQVACVLHQGDYITIRNAYIALHLWLSTSGYQRSGPCREIYHRSIQDTTDVESYLTEIQLPIQPIHET